MILNLEKNGHIRKDNLFVYDLKVLSLVDGLIFCRYVCICSSDVNCPPPSKLEKLWQNAMEFGGSIRYKVLLFHDRKTVLISTMVTVVLIFWMTEFTSRLLSLHCNSTRTGAYCMSTRSHTSSLRVHFKKLLSPDKIYWFTTVFETHSGVVFTIVSKFLNSVGLWM